MRNKKLSIFLSCILALLLTVSVAFGTVSSSTSRIAYDCNGSTVNFAFTFGVSATSEIQVILTSAAGSETVLTETTNYSVSCTNDDCESGGTVTTVSTYASGNTITILRNVPLTQESDFTEGMPTLYETFEDGLDKNIRISQQQQEEINRTPKLAKSSAYAGTDYTFPDPSASTLIGWDSSASDLTTYSSTADYCATSNADFYYPNYGAADQGATGNSDTIKYYVDTIGTTNNAVIYLRHNSGSQWTDYVFSTTDDYTNNGNIKFIIEKGARFAPASGITVTLPCSLNVNAQPNQQIKTGDGSLVFGSSSGFVYPEWWGIDGAADDVEFNAAIDSGVTTIKAYGSAYSTTSSILIDQNNTTLEFNESTVVTSATDKVLNISGDNVRVINGTITQGGSSSTYTVIHISGDGLNIKNVTINGVIGTGQGDSSGLNTGIYFLGVNGAKIDNCNIYEKGYGICSNESSNIEIVECDITYGMMGIHLHALTSESASGCKIKYNTLGLASVVYDTGDSVRGIRTSYMSDVDIIGNTALGGQLEIECWRASSHAQISNVKIIGNTVDRFIFVESVGVVISDNIIDYSLLPVGAPADYTANVGIEIKSSDVVGSDNIVKGGGTGVGLLLSWPADVFDYPPIDVQLSNTHIYNWEYGVSIGANCKNIILKNTHIQTCSTVGLYVSGGLAFPTFVENVQLIGGTIHDMTLDGISIAGVNGIIVDDFAIWDCADEGIKLGTSVNPTWNGLVTNCRITKCKYGLSYSGGYVRDVAVVGNHIYGNTTSQITVFTGVCGLVSNNIGYVRSHANPIGGTWVLGTRFETSDAVSTGKRCTSSGTMGTLSGVTGTIAVGSDQLTVNSANYLQAGQYITITNDDASTTDFIIESILGNVVTTTANATKDATAKSVAWTTAVFGNY